MRNQFLKFVTSTGEQRWINLSRVTRVSLATESCGSPVLVFCFDSDDHVRIHGTDTQNRTLIADLADMLDTMVEVDPARPAA